MEIITDAELFSSRGDASIKLNVVEYIEVDGVNFALIKLVIDGSDWPSNDLLGKERKLTNLVNDHGVILSQLVVSIESLLTLSLKLRNWIQNQELFDIELTDLTFQKANASLYLNSEKIRDTTHPDFLLQFRGNKLSILYELRVDQSCLNCFCDGLDSIINMSK